jgi:hypothetical protein
MRTISILFVSVVLAGCDFYYGVSRSENLDQFIDHRCVKAALEKVDGITDIRYEFREGGRPLGRYGLAPPDQVHYYYYKTHGLNGYVYILVDYKLRSSFHQSYGALNAKPPQEQIDIIRPIMSEIERAIEQTCNIEGFASRIRESCMDVRCTALKE